MIFNIHNERVFGVKKLTDADLGRGTSHQTHIGLYEGVLSYLNDSDETKEAYLVYRDRCDRLHCYFDRIENPDGTFRSPKIRYGATDSIVKKIREYADGTGAEYYLLWFGLDNNELIFFLFDKDSDDYKFFLTRNLLRGKFDFSEEIRQYVFSRFNQTNDSILLDLELNCQGFPIRKRYRRIDIERANELFKATGRTGEELACKFLERQKHDSAIKDFSWVNQSRESGLPYDFTIIQNDNAERFVDVKTTRFVFETPMAFSSQEVSFIATAAPLYSVFRAYNIGTLPLMRICDNSIDKMQIIFNDCNAYSAACIQHGYTSQSTVFVTPADPLFSFTDEIYL